MNQYIVYMKSDTGKDSKDAGSLHIGTLMTISGDMATSSLYNITTGIYSRTDIFPTFCTNTCLINACYIYVQHFSHKTIVNVC